MNLILATDSYKLGHGPMYMPGTLAVHSYFEVRDGAEFDETVWYGIQGIIMEHLVGEVITTEMIDEAQVYVDAHMGPGVFNREGWEYIVEKYHDRLPVKIWSVPEGGVYAPGTPLLAIENTDPELWWLSSYLETYLVQVWYPMTVASLSYAIKGDIADSLLRTTGSTEGIDFMLHDFGCRGATCMEAAGRGGAAHLVSFKGTDTDPALMYAHKYYEAALETLGFSVLAAEHSIMTALGRQGEAAVVEHLLNTFPTGILAAPIDSFDYVNYVTYTCGTLFRQRILERDGKFVFRPDSTSTQHPTPEDEMVWLLNELWGIFGGTINDLGFKVLNPKVGALWGDGIDRAGINKILAATEAAGFATSNYLFGMGGALLQKVNRDTQRCAFKSSAQFRDGQWYSISKETEGKVSKSGRQVTDQMNLIYDAGNMVEYTTFEQIRKNADAHRA